MSGETHSVWRKDGEIHVVILGRGRDKFAHESAQTMLQPGEELEPLYASWPKYGYTIKVVATPILVTPEERALIIEALESAARTLRQNTMGYYPSNIIEANNAAAAHDALRKRIKS